MTPLRTALVCAVLTLCAPFALARTLCDPSNMIPFVPAAGWPNGWQGFVRLNSANYGSPLLNALGAPDERTYTFTAIDDAGNAYRMSANVPDQAALHFNSQDLEWGNSAKGDLPGTGAPPEAGHWRLCFDSSPRPRRKSAYIRTRDGFLTDMTAPVPSAGGFAHLDNPEWRIPIFNPGRNTAQVSVLRIINNTNRDLSIRIHGQREDGRINPDRLGVCTAFRCDDQTYVQGWLHAATAVHVTSAQLESGEDVPLQECDPSRTDSCFETLGAIGPSAGKWSVYVSLAGYSGFDPEDALVVMNLMQTPTGHITNLPHPAR